MENSFENGKGIIGDHKVGRTRRGLDVVSGSVVAADALYAGPA
jgi:hypothetical protein